MNWSQIVTGLKILNILQAYTIQNLACKLKKTTGFFIFVLFLFYFDFIKNIIILSYDKLNQKNI